MAFDSQASAIAPNNSSSTVALARTQPSQNTANVAVNKALNIKANSIAVDLTGANSNQTPGNVAVNKASSAKADKTITSSTLKKVVDSLNSLSDNLNIGTKFEVFEKMKGVYYIKIYNKKTNETISEFPPIKYLDMIATFIKNTGNLLDRKV